MPHADCGRETAPNELDTTKRIRQLNDALRQTFIGGIVACTDGFTTLPSDLHQRFVAAVKAFDTFTRDTDPHGEHDFGSIDLDGVRVFWKIDYYDYALIEGSPDPTDPAKTLRVLTIMLASEY